MEELKQLLERMDKLEQRMTLLEGKVLNSQSTQNAGTAPLQQSTAQIGQKSQPPQFQPQPQAQPQQHFAPNIQYSPKTMPAANAKPAAPKRSSNLELEFGTKWISRIGVAAILLAVVFFLKYSFDNNIIGAKGRIFVGILFGISMLFCSDYIIKKYRITATVLMGGAISVLGFSIFAAFSFYELIGQITALVLFIILVLVSAFLALRYDSVAVMHFGVITGFLTPLLISTGTPNDRFFLTYLVILNVGIMAATYFKNWKSLYYASFFLSVISYGAWMINRFEIYEFSEVRTQFLLASVGLSALFVQYLFISLCMNLSKKIKIEKYTFEFYLTFLNATAFYGAAYHIVDTYNEKFDGIYTLCMAFLYFGLFMFMKFRVKDAKPMLLSLLGLAMFFVTITIPVQLDGNSVTLSWSVEALLFAIISRKIEVPHLKKAYLAVSVLAVFMLAHDLFAMEYNDKTVAFFNMASLKYVASIVCLGVMAYIVREGLPRISVVYLVVLNLLFLGFLLSETDIAYYRLMMQNKSALSYYSDSGYIYAKELTQSAILILYSMALIFIGIMRKSKSTRVFALVLFAIAVLKVFFYDLASLVGIYRILSFVGLGVILIAISMLYQKFKHIIVGGTQNDEKITD